MHIDWRPEGFSETELNELVSPPQQENLHSEFGFRTDSSWVAEVYGYGKLLREYGFFPASKPLKIQIIHGIPVDDDPSQMDFKHPFESMFYHTDRLVEKWKKQSQRPVYALESPYAYYCRSRKVRKKPDARGCLVFPAHDTHFTTEDTDYTQFIEELNALPETFKPVGVCCYWLDIVRGKHQIFLDHGFPVYTAGHWSNPFFVENFFEILTHYDYSLSNTIGSYAFYSVFIDIPFSLYGNGGNTVNAGNETVALRTSNRKQDWAFYSELYREFMGLRTSITPRARELVQQEMRPTGRISRLHFSYLLYRSLRSHGSRK